MVPGHYLINLVINLFSLIFSPVFIFLSNLFLIVKYRKFYPFSFSIALAIVYTYMPIQFDVVSNFSGYLRIIQVSQLYTGEFNLYRLTPALLNDFSGTNYMFFVFVSVFICVYIWSKILEFEISLCRSNLVFVLFLFSMLSLLLHRYIVDINRTYLSISLFLIYYYRTIRDLKTSYFVVTVLFFASISIHIFSIVFWLACFSKIIKIKNNGLAFLIVSFSLVVSFYIFYTTDYLGLRTVSQYYFTSGFGVVSDEVSLYSTVTRYIRLPILILFSYLLFKYGRFDMVIAIVIIMSLLLFPFVTFGQRFYIAFLIICIPNLLTILNSKKANRLTCVFVILLFFQFLIHFYAGFLMLREEYDVFNNQKEKLNIVSRPIYYPSVLLISHHYGYDDEMLSVHTSRGW
ncbi:TPA: hypothetical protein RQK30_000577 [Vibrio vulnificus]|nr:hypothetical protein [Vibrio vulnificus]